jgi:hypothetical protein
MKSKTLGYTIEPLNRESAPAPTFASTTKQVWTRIKSCYIVDFFKFYAAKFNNNQTIKLFFTNGRKYQNEKNLTEWAKDYSRNRQMQRIHDAWGNPNPHQENTQQIINDIKFGRL